VHGTQKHSKLHVVVTQRQEKAMQLSSRKCCMQNNNIVSTTKKQKADLQFHYKNLIIANNQKTANGTI